ncbi:MAG TPA: RecQ family ATP-dependent DNA helicase [Vicinamibacteria bacterium]|nr:RecQ family ATP-dependent DNA helicase [Vicinamibacteria bacterium]
MTSLFKKEHGESMAKESVGMGRRTGRRRRRGRARVDGHGTRKPPRSPRRRDVPSSAIERAAHRLGIEVLRPQQTRIIEHVLKHKDALAVLPTGFGKSACYQVPSMLLKAPVVVVSPLLALLQDQYEKLIAREIPTVRLDSTVRGKARREALERLSRGGSLLVMTTPETLASDEVSKALKGGISLVAVDEAHASSEWGHDFRPAYLRLGEVLGRYGATATLGLTATATEAVRKDLVRILNLKDPLIVAESPDRPNLRFDVIPCSGAARLRALGRLVLRLGRPGIIYCSTTRDVDAVYGALGKLRIPVQRYHGKMTGKQRREQQELFMRRGRRVIMVATSAFGLGIDKPDIRYIMHYQTPASLEQYVQEAGRAGRDGNSAHCVLLYDPEDRQIHEFLLSRSRIRPDQLVRLAATLTSWIEEGREPSLSDLAGTAGLARRVAQALVAVFEDAGLVSMTSAGIVETLVAAEALERDSRLLIQRLTHLRDRDANRLDSVAHYATTERCRAQLLREYFGVPAGHVCGSCDICQGGSRRPDSFFKPLQPLKKTVRGRNRRRGRRRRRGAARPPTQNAPPRVASGNTRSPVGSLPTDD